MCVEGACTADEPPSGGGTGGNGAMGGKGGGGGKAGASTGGMSGSGGTPTGGGEGGEAPGSAGQGGTPAVVDCGELGQDCCESGPACKAGQNLACGQGNTCECDLGFEDCENGAADGCEASPSDDPDHCGGCGHACGGDATCVASICQAESLVASGTQDGQAFTNTWNPGGGYQSTFSMFDANGIVLPSTHQGSGEYRMRAFDLDGTPGAFITTVLLSIGRGPYVTSSGVFWLDPNDASLLRRAPRGGGAVTTPVDTAQNMNVKVIDGDLYYQEGSNLAKIPGGSLTPTPLYDTFTSIVFAASGDEVFTFGAASQLMRGTAGAALAIEYAAILPPSCGGTAMIADDKSVFLYGACSDDPEGYIVRYDYTDTPQAGTRQVILKDIPAIKEVTFAQIVGDWFYFVDNGGPYKLYRIKRSGGTPELLLSNGPFYGLGSDANYFYTFGGAPGPDGFSRIRIPLP